jgi:hypothetical protein
LKNLNFVVDHNSRGRRRALRNRRYGFSRKTRFAACGLRMSLVTTMMSRKLSPRSKARFSSALIFRLFQQNRRKAEIQIGPPIRLGA